MKNKRFPARGASLCCLLLFSACLLNAEVLIPASNANINYYGRLNFTDPAEPAYGWSGVIIEANFSGSTIGVRITDGNTASYYDVEIDGALQNKLRYTSKISRYILSTTLTGGSHKIRLILRNETHWNLKTFQGEQPPPDDVIKREYSVGTVQPRLLVFTCLAGTVSDG